MKSIIKKLIVFGDDDQKRIIQFKEGLNIITGDSKTGKSSILEIIDYCLFSSRSTIPKGIITDFSRMFSLILKADDKYLVVSRLAAPKQTKASLNISTKLPSDDEISFHQFSKNLRPLKEVQLELERHLGLSVSNPLSTNDHAYNETPKKVTIRSSLSLILQHQNIIANKLSLFYRFDDFQKRKKFLQDYPVLIGWANSQYYDLQRTLDQLEQKLKAVKKAAQQVKLGRSDYIQELRSAILPYYKLHDKEVAETSSLSEIKKMAQTLPEPTIASYSFSNTKNKIQAIESEIESLTNTLTEKNILIHKLSSNTILSNDYQSRLNFLSLISDEANRSNEGLCPICKSKTDKNHENIEALKTSKDKLGEEISKITGYTQDNTKQIGTLKKERNQIQRQINRLKGQIVVFEKEDKDFIQLKSRRESALIMKGQTLATVAQLEDRYKSKDFDKDISSLKEEIQQTKEYLDKYDIKKTTENATNLIYDKMNEICKQLDFEEELRPGNLKFSLTNFDLVYEKKDEQIRLSEMGSGANWLACHLSLFLSLLYLNCKSEKSNIPAVLVIDQPSQVYFPKSYAANNVDDINVKQVKNIFKVIADQVESISKETGFTPQIIVLEHANEPEFAKYVIRHWQQEGQKLI